MESKGIRDDISKGFADLTALLEDAAVVAAEGQSPHRTMNELEELTRCLRPEIIRIDDALAGIERLILSRRNN